MRLQLKICQDLWGTWSVHGLSPVPVSHLPSLSASVEYARKACGAAPATIELFVDGMYLVAHQERGWSRRLVGPAIHEEPPAETERGVRVTSIRNRLLCWLRRVRSLSAKDRLSNISDEGAPRPAS